MTNPGPAPTGAYVFSPKLRSRSVVRTQISRYSSQIIGLNIKGILNGQETFIDPDIHSITLDLYLEDNPDTETPPGNLIDTVTDTTGLIHNSTGVYTFVLQPDQTLDASLLTGIWKYTVQGAQFVYYDFYEIVDPMLTFDGLSDEQKSVVRQTSWQMGDLYDSTDGGPHLIEEFQTKYGYERLAQLLLIACQRLNYESIPLTHFVIGKQVGAQLPDTWIGVLQWSHYIEVLSHLKRSYVEQPLIDGGPGVAMANRRDYLNRWQSIYNDEYPKYQHAVRMFKRKMLNLGSGALIVSGGIFGRGSGLFKSTYAAETRGGRFMYPMSFIGVVPNHS